MKLPTRLLPRYTLLLALCAALPTAYAVDCANAMTQTDMNDCAAKDLNTADAELNQTYVALRAKLSPARKNQIRDVQLAWIKYRDLSCRFDSAGAAGGSAAPMAMQGCLAEKTRQRTKELKALGNCQEGDVSCTRP